MTGWYRIAVAGARAEASQLWRSPLLVALAIVQAITFLLLVSLFGLTGSRAPTGIVDQDRGALAQRFIAELAQAHRSFSLRSMSATAADTALRKGDLVAVVTIPAGFSSTIARGGTVALPLAVDNVDADLTDDVQRALPSAILAFGREQGFPDIRLRPVERDVLDHDTDFIPYLVVSALALDALVVAGVLAAISVAREFETGTGRVLALAPVHALVPISGRLVATAVVSLLALGVTALFVALLYHVVPLHVWEVALGLTACVVIFTCLGAAVGSMIRRTLPVAALMFGLALPLYIDSGSLEPERFDGDLIWGLAHASPVYYAVGVLEHAFHGLRVTPEPVWADLLALAGWAIAALGGAWYLLGRRLAR
jgi:ABC-2 type transport system permease protein